MKKAKIPSLKTLKKKADILWSKIIKAKYNNQCAFCPETYAIAGHHIRSRRFGNTRWDTDNGVSCCRSHHWQAHKDPEAFRRQLRDLIGEKMIDSLFKKSQKIVNIDRLFLERTIKSLEKEVL